MFCKAGHKPTLHYARPNAPFSDFLRFTPAYESAIQITLLWIGNFHLWGHEHARDATGTPVENHQNGGVS